MLHPESRRLSSNADGAVLISDPPMKTAYTPRSESCSEEEEPTTDSEAQSREEIVLSSFLSQARGVIGRYPEPNQEFVFEFEDVGERAVHMVGVRRPLRVEWYVDDDLVRVETLSPWTGYAAADADRVIERRPS